MLVQSKYLNEFLYGTRTLREKKSGMIDNSIYFFIYEPNKKNQARVYDFDVQFFNNMEDHPPQIYFYITNDSSRIYSYNNNIFDCLISVVRSSMLIYCFVHPLNQDISYAYIFSSFLYHFDSQQLKRMIIILLNNFFTY